jgi:hypothetical protein
MSAKPDTPPPRLPQTVKCSCGESFTGTPDEVAAWCRKHDDSPWMQHVVVWDTPGRQPWSDELAIRPTVLAVPDLGITKSDEELMFDEFVDEGPVAQLQSLVAELTRRYAKDLELMCERSLKDRLERGVLVTKGPDPGQWTMRLDKSVPWGMVHERRPE